MRAIETANIVVSGPLHNNEPTADEVIAYMNQFPAEGVFPYRVPHEAPAGERFEGISELGGHFPGDKNSDDPEDRVADRMVSDLKPVAHWLGIDIHDTPLQNGNYLVVGDVATPEQLGLAIVLGMDKVATIPNYPFFESFPKFVTAETTRDPANNPLSQPGHWRDQLARIAALGPGGLRRIFERHGGDLTYYFEVDIPLIGRNALSLAQVTQLEHIPFSGEVFEKVTLPSEIAASLGIEDGATRICTWNHANNAKESIDLGVTHEGVQRREFFGAVFVETDAPTAIGKAALRFSQRGSFHPERSSIDAPLSKVA